MSKLLFNEKSITIEEGESVLDALLSNNISIPYGCRAGACQSCMMKVADGQHNRLPAKAQTGLKPSQKSLGYFLSCCCYPVNDLKIALVDQTRERFKATVIEASKLNDQVLRVRLESTMQYIAGQYLNIWLDPNTIRSYSIASTPSQGFIELHIKIIPNGKFSQWAQSYLKAGDTLTLQGPLGQCIYTPDEPSAPLLMAGIGTGLAPLYGVLQDALTQSHQGPIHLVVGARRSSQLYLQKELLDLANQYENLKVDFVAQELDTTDGPNQSTIEGDLYHVVKTSHTSTKGYQVFLCGAESFVSKMKKQCFLHGAAMNQIHTDAFLPGT